MKHSIRVELLGRFYAVKIDGRIHNIERSRECAFSRAVEWRELIGVEGELTGAIGEEYLLRVTGTDNG